MIELEYLNLKIYLLKDILLIGAKKYQYHGHIVFKDLNGEEILGSFYDRELQKTKLQCMYKMSSKYFPPYESASNTVKVKLDLTNYATEADVKNITHVDVSSYATKTSLAALKSEVDKIDVDKLKTVPVDLAKLTNVVKNDAIRKTDYNNKVTST